MTNTNTGTMSADLKTLTTKAKSALTRESSARYALAEVLHKVKSEDLAKGYLSAKAIKDLGNGMTAFSAWYQTELGLSAAEVNVMVSWVESSTMVGQRLTIGVSKAIASTPERHGKTKAENVKTVYENASVKGKPTQQGIRKARRDLKLEVKGKPSTSAPSVPTAEPTPEPPVKVGIMEAMALLQMALIDTPTIKLTKAENGQAERLIKAIKAITN